MVQSNVVKQSTISFDRPRDFWFRKSENFSKPCLGKWSSLPQELFHLPEEDATMAFVVHKTQLVVPTSIWGYDSLDFEDLPEDSNKESDLYQEMAMPKWRSRGSIEVGWKDYESGEKQPDRSSVESKGSDSNRMKFQRLSPASTNVKKSREKRDGSGSGSRTPGGAWKPISDNQETSSLISTASMEQAQRVKQSKGNNKLNAELKQKANELEKLFSVHKLRVPRNQSVKTEEREASLASKDSLVKDLTPPTASTKTVPEPPHSSYKKKSISGHLTQWLTKQDFDDTPKQNRHGVGSSDQSRGKLYYMYTQKRDAKLKEEWSSKRAEKEARMKFLEDSLERSRSEMKSKLAGFSDRRDSLHRVEKLRLFTSLSGIRQKQVIVRDEDEEEQAEFGQANLTTETYMANGSFRSPESKKAPLINNAVSSTSTNSTKASGSSAGRQKVQPETSPPQSAPNFSGFRKENMKQSTTASKGRRRPQGRHYYRSKSFNNDVHPFEEKERHPQYSKNEHEDELLKSTEGGKFSKKGIAPDIPRSRASFATKTFVNAVEEYIYTAKEQDLESTVDEDYDNMDNGRPRWSQGSVKSANSWWENGDVPSQSNSSTMAEIPAAMPSAFFSMVAALNSDGESPGSGNPRLHKSYSYKHEISGFDASIDSPTGSPAFLNTHYSETSRMKKYVVPGSSHSPSHGKDVKKGLKRFLKFGRKDRTTDILAEWVSVTTSEGDDDTEDGKYPTSNKSLQGLRKSRMGLLHYRNVDGFSEADSFSEQAPKSCFSLSPFRSKGSNSKPR